MDKQKGEKSRSDGGGLTTMVPVLESQRDFAGDPGVQLAIGIWVNTPTTERHEPRAEARGGISCRCEWQETVNVISFEACNFSAGGQCYHPSTELSDVLLISTPGETQRGHRRWGNKVTSRLGWLTTD